MGIVTGLYLLPFGIQAVFTFGRNDNLLSALMIVTLAFSMLPLSVIAAWRPRIAAIGILSSVGLFLTCSVCSTMIQLAKGPLELNLIPFASFVLPSAIVGGLLLRATPPAKLERDKKNGSML